MAMLFLLFHFISPRIIGLSPTLKKEYYAHIDTKANTFTCFDKSKVIPLSKLNDNYRDCDDGSDEIGTSHGPSSIPFYCKNKKHLPRNIPRWSVGDGICDCCDGSDEKFNSHSECQNVCEDLENQRNTLMKELKEIYEESFHKKEERIQEGKKMVDSFEEKKQKYQTKIDRYERKIKKIKEGIKTPTPTPLPIVPDEFVNVSSQSTDENSEDANESSENNETSENNDNRENSENNEKNENNETNENTENSDNNKNNTEKSRPIVSPTPKPTPAPTPVLRPKKNIGLLINIWRFIFFISKDDIAFSEVFMRQKDGRVKLYKSKISNWRTKLDSVDFFKEIGQREKLPDSFVSLYKKEFSLDGGFKLTFMKELRQDGTSLGSYSTIEGDVTKYTNGAHCWQTQSGRKTEMKLICGKEDRLINVVEANICEFKAVFATPSICSGEEVAAIGNMTVNELTEIKRQIA